MRGVAHFLPDRNLANGSKGSAAKGTGLRFNDVNVPGFVLRPTANRVFRIMAMRRKINVDGFTGIKLHLVIRHKGDNMAGKITKGNGDDGSAVKGMTDGLEGWTVAEKGLVSGTLLQKVW